VRSIEFLQAIAKLGWEKRPERIVYGQLSKKWSHEEINFLVTRFSIMTDEELAKALGRSLYSIRNKARRLNLKKSWHHVPPLYNKCNIKLNEVQKAQLAMMIDTDGTLTIAQTRDEGYLSGLRLVPHMIFVNSNKALVEHFNKLVGNKPNQFSIRKTKTHWKKVYISNLGSMSRLHAILNQIQEYLIGKRKQARLIIELIEIEDKLFRENKHPYTERQLQIRNEVVLLNRRGEAWSE
jgi:hypothetical protein